MFQPEVVPSLYRIERKVDVALQLLRAVLREEQFMSAELDALTAQVKQNTDLEQSAVTLIHGLADQIAAAKDDPAKLQQLTSELKSKADALAAAITANATPTGGGGGGTPAPAAGRRKQP
jgi:hypothetical protein